MAYAEDIVHGAWIRALRDACDYTGAVMQAASARCDAARRNLAAALLGPDPEAIAVAYADLEGRLVNARVAARAYGQAREALDEELNGAHRQAVDRLSGDLVSGGWMPERPEESASGQGPGLARRALLTLGRLSRHVMFSLVRLAAGRRL